LHLGDALLQDLTAHLCEFPESNRDGKTEITLGSLIISVVSLNHLIAIPKIEVTRSIIPSTGGVKHNNTTLALETSRVNTAVTVGRTVSDTVAEKLLHNGCKLAHAEDVATATTSSGTTDGVGTHVRANEVASAVEGLRHADSAGVGDPVGVNSTAEASLNLLRGTLGVAVTELVKVGVAKTALHVRVEGAETSHPVTTGADVTSGNTTVATLRSTLVGRRGRGSGRSGGGGGGSRGSLLGDLTQAAAVVNTTWAETSLETTSSLTIILSVIPASTALCSAL